MTSRPDDARATWMIFAIPAAALLLPLSVALLIVGFRPESKPSRSVAISAPDSPAKSPSLAEPISPTSTPATPAPSPGQIATPLPTAIEPKSALPATPAAPAPAGNPSGAVAFAPTHPPGPASPTIPPAPSTNRAAGSAIPAIDLLASLDLGTAIAHGEWTRDVTGLHCSAASSRNRGKLRLGPPPTGPGYDFAVTFTPQGTKPMLAQILSFRGRQFIFSMSAKQSGFALVDRKIVAQNETMRPKGITADTKHTAMVKVRETEVSAYLDGELLTSYATDYSNLDAASNWSLGENNAKDNLIGVGVESPVEIEAITLTPLERQSPASSIASNGSPTPAPTAAPTTKSPPSSYKDLAAMISSPYSTDSSAAATQPAARPRIDPARLQAFAATQPSAVADAVAGMLQPPATAAAANDPLFRALQLSAAPPPIPADPLLEAHLPDASAAALDRTEFDAEQARLSAWGKLAAKMDELYPEAKPQSDLVKLQFTPYDAAKQKPATFFATHANAQPLTNVTLAIESVRARTSPSPTAVHYYFIPRWSPGQKIYFPVAPTPNVSSPELLDPSAAPAVNARSGMILARAQLWSDKLSQQKQETTFDTKLEPLGRLQLDEAYRLVDEALRPPPASRPAGANASPPSAARTVALIPGPIMPRADLADTAPEFAPARAAAARADALLTTAQSPLADEAKALAAKPATALRTLREKQVDAFVNALPLHSMRTGVWVVHQPGMLAKLAKQSDRDAVLAAAGSAGGRITLTIDARAIDGTGIVATLASADPPEQKKKFAGRLQVDASANRILLNLRAQPPSAKALTEADLKRLLNWSSIVLELRGNSLIGIATVGPPETATVLNVAFGSSTAAPEATAKPAPQKPPKPAK